MTGTGQSKTVCSACLVFPLESPKKGQRSSPSSPLAPAFCLLTTLSLPPVALHGMWGPVI